MSVGVVLRFLKERQYGDPGAGPASPSRSARREPVRTLSRRHLARAVQDAARDRADPLYRAFGLRRLLVDLDQIGRASCRERVCQYVSISVVAGSLQKKDRRISDTSRKMHTTIR